MRRRTAERSQEAVEGFGRASSICFHARCEKGVPHIFRAAAHVPVLHRVTSANLLRGDAGSRNGTDCRAWRRGRRSGGPRGRCAALRDVCAFDV